MGDWGWRFALVGMAFAWWALLTQPSEPGYCYGCMCERRYFNPASMLDPVVWKVKTAEDFKRAWASERPVLIASEYDQLCTTDGTLLTVYHYSTEI